VAISLVGVVIGSATILSTSDREKLTEVLNDFERLARFATNEAILRNRVVRIKFDLNKLPAEYVVEFGAHDQILIPSYQSKQDQYLINEEANKKAEAEFNQAFNIIPEFKDNSREINEDVIVIGVSSTESNELISEGTFSIYFYPNGTRDASIIIFTTIEEVASLKIDGVRDRTLVQFYSLEDVGLDQYQERALEKGIEIVEKWVSENS
jgi:hypothetical protein